MFFWIIEECIPIWSNCHNQYPICQKAYENENKGELNTDTKKDENKDESKSDRQKF